MSLGCRAPNTLARGRLRPGTPLVPGFLRRCAVTAWVWWPEMSFTSSGFFLQNYCVMNLHFFYSRGTKHFLGLLQCDNQILEVPGLSVLPLNLDRTGPCLGSSGGHRDVLMAAKPAALALPGLSASHPLSMATVCTVRTTGPQTAAAGCCVGTGRAQAVKWEAIHVSRAEEGHDNPAHASTSQGILQGTALTSGWAFHVLLKW